MAAEQKETKTDIADEARTLGVKGSKIDQTRSKSKNKSKEATEHEKLADKRLENRIDKAKVSEKTTKIQKRRLMIEAKLKGRNTGGQTRFSDSTCKQLLAELKVIKNTPKQWKAMTKNGTLPYPITAAKKKTVGQMINDEMDLD